MIYFTPPGRREHRGNHPLFGRLLFTQGVSLLKTSGIYRQVAHPTDEECAGADVLYLGGYVYEIDADEAADLTAAGYGEWITEPVYGFGLGLFGRGLYGIGGA